MVGDGGGGRAGDGSGGDADAGTVGRVDVDFAHASAQVVQEFDAGGRVDGRRTDVGREVVGHFGGAVRVPGAELVRVHRIRAGGAQPERVPPFQFVQMPHGQLQYVGLFQFAHVLALGL